MAFDISTSTVRLFLSCTVSTIIICDGKCDKARHDMNEHKLKLPSNFCNRYGVSVGDSLLNITSEQLVVVKATSIPADTKSSK